MSPKKFVFAAAIFMTTTFIGQAQTPSSKIKMIDYVRGTWKIQKIYDGKKEVTDSAHLENRRLVLDVDGKFKRTSDNQKTAQGSYRVNESQHILYLESVSDRAPEEWKFTVSNNKLILQDKNVPRYKYVYIKAKAG